MNFNLGKADGCVVWLDLDDTLWNFRLNSVKALTEVYAAFGLDRFWKDNESWLNDYHLVNDRLWAELADGRITADELRVSRFRETFVNKGMSLGEAEKISGRADTFYLGLLGKMKELIPGAKELLERLKDGGFKVGILSNGFQDVQFNKIESSGIGAFIDYVVLSEDIGISKPDKRIFDYAATKAGVSPYKCIMIGDNGETDIAGALNAGWAEAVWFNPDGKSPQVKLCGALSHPGRLTVVTDLSQITVEL